MHGGVKFLLLYIIGEKFENMKCSVVVPCYNEEGNIEELTKQFIPVKDKFGENEFELILVDNGSKDLTSNKIDEQASKYSFIKKVTVEVNKGYGFGVYNGLKAATGEYLSWIHADLQFSPQYIIDEYKMIPDGEISKKIFIRGLRKKRPLSDTFFTLCMSIFESIYLGTKLFDINGQPTIMHRSLFDNTEEPPYDFSFDLFYYYMARKNGYVVKRLPVVQHERNEGESTWNNGFNARVNLIKRTLKFSVELRKRFKK